MMRQKYTADSAERELRRLLDNPVYAVRAEAVAQRVCAEDGITRACDTVTQFLASKAG
jgi:hypothetical protein